MASFYTVAGYRGTNDDVSSVAIEEASTPLVAGKPYIFLASADAQTFSVTGDVEDAPVTTENHGLVGQFAAGNITDNNYTYILKNNQICKVVGNAVNCPATRAYFNFSGESALSAPGRYIDIPCTPSNATNIEGIDASEEAIKFIQNGKLFIKKNGAVYDLLGKRVK